MFHYDVNVGVMQFFHMLLFVLPCDTNIMKCTEERDLGVMFDKGLIFDTHVQSAINKANSMLGII